MGHRASPTAGTPARPPGAGLETLRKAAGAVPALGGPGASGLQCGP